MLGMMAPMLADTAANAPQATAPQAAPTPAVAPTPAAAPQPAPAPAEGLQHKKTMLGMSPFAGMAAGTAPTPAAAPAVTSTGAQPPGKLLTPAHGSASARPAAPAPSGPPPKRTVFGVDEAELAPMQTAQTPVAQPGRQADPSHRTMLGVSPGAAPQPAAPSGKPAIDPRTKQTMLGAAPVMAQPPAAPAGPQVAAALSAPPRSTPVAVPVAAQPTPMNAQPLSFSRPAPAMPDADDSVALPATGNKGLWIGVGAMAVVVIVGALLALKLTSGPKLEVRILREGGSDALEIQAPGSAPGTKVRFGGIEQPLVAGRAKFPLLSDSLDVGDNELAIDVVSSSGSVDGATVALRVDYRVRTDLTPLSADPPAIDVLIDAVPGSRVTLDGQPVTLDARGHAVKRYVVPPQAGSSYALAARYAIAGAGAPVQGDVSVTLPVTTMQIDKPGPDVVTDQASLEIAGGVEPGATVQVGGVPVVVNGGRFLYRASLPKAGDYTFDVIARLPGKAPRQVPIRARRVEDMALAAATFEADKTLTYARIAPNPVIYRGQKVAFDGRVYNVEVQAGRSLLQLLVLDCPGAQRCPLWVEYSQATDATVDTWVRVLGTVSGEQQFRSKQGQVQNVPSVNAQYVLRLAR